VFLVALNQLTIWPLNYLIILISYNLPLYIHFSKHTIRHHTLHAYSFLWVCGSFLSDAYGSCSTSWCIQR